MREDNFVMGVDAAFRLKDTDEYLLAGNVSGTLHLNDRVRVWNPGSDAGEVFESRALMIEVGPHQPVEEATGQRVALVLEGAAMHVIRPASVVSSIGAAPEAVRNAYVLSVLSNFVIVEAEGEGEGGTADTLPNNVPSDAALEEMTVSDLAEAYWLYGWHYGQMTSEKSKALLAKGDAWRERVGNALFAKLATARTLFCVFDPQTDSPAKLPLVQPFDLSGGATPAGANSCAIRIYPPAVSEIAEAFAKDAGCELRRIDLTDENPTSSFFADLFWKQGVIAVQVVNGQTQLDIRRLITSS